MDEYTFNATFFNLFHTKTTYLKHATSALISDEVITNQNLLPSGKSFWHTVTKVVRTNYLQYFPTELDYTYDSNGNLIYQKTNTNNVMDIDETFYNNMVSNGSWLPSNRLQFYKNYSRVIRYIVEQKHFYIILTELFKKKP